MANLVIKNNLDVTGIVRTNGLELSTKNYVDTVSGAYVPLTQKGTASGVATLDAGGKVPVTQLPNSVMEYKGTYNASTNTPTLVNGTGDIGDVYRVNVAGAGVNSLNFIIGDYVIYNGTAWEKAHSGADAVNSVNGFAGVVVLTTTDIAEGTNLYFTDTRARTAAVQDTIVDGVTTIAPSQNAVFDALALKVNTADTIQINRGGTGQITQQAAINALSLPGASGTVLRSDGTNAVFSAIQASDVPTLNQNTTGTASNVTGIVAIANGGTGQSTQTNAYDALSPNTTKGDITVNNGTDNVRQAIGANNSMLVADSTQANGVKWTTPSSPTIQRFNSGSGTYTTPANAKYLIVTIVGGGGGGGSSGTAAFGAGGNGNQSSFGNSGVTIFATSNGGTVGSQSGSSGGGAVALVVTSGTAATISGLQGGIGSGSSFSGVSNGYWPGGDGGSNSYAPGPGGPSYGSTANSGQANTGVGGAGGAGSATGLSNFYSGGGGGAGGVNTILVSGTLAATYPYVVGSGGAGGSAGTSGLAGAAGSAGTILVQEFYN